MVEMSVLWLRRSALLALMAGLALGADPANVAELRRGFERPPDDARMMVRWWWFGPSVTKAELEREMRFMKQGGIGGFEVQPTYALELDDPAKGIKNLPFMSAELLSMLTFTGEKAKELGLRMDLTLGSGWPFGGPHIPVELASPRLRVLHGAPEAMPALQAGEKLLAVFVDGKRAVVVNGKVSVPVGTSGQATFFISSQTRQTVKRPAVGAEGWVLNHYDTAALQAHFKAVGEPMLKALDRTPPYAIFSDSLEVYNSDWSGNFLAEFQKRRGLRPDAVPARAGRRHRAADRRDPPRLGPDAERTLRRPVPAAAQRVGADARHEVPVADLWDSAGDAFQPAPGGSTRGRRHAVETVFDDALGIVGQPSIWSSRDLKRDMDVASLAGVPCHAARYESGGRPALPTGRESVGGARLAVYSAFGSGAGLAVLRGGGIQSAQPVVDRDAGHHDLPAACELALAARSAGHRCRSLHADARRLRGFHAGARFGQPGDGRANRSGTGTGDSGRGLQLRFHGRWSDRGKGHHPTGS